MSTHDGGSCVHSDEEFGQSGNTWDSLKVRHAFIRKVKAQLVVKIWLCYFNWSFKINCWKLKVVVCLFVYLQVYLILASQLLVTTAIVAVFTFV